MSKQLLVDAIVGRGFFSIPYAYKMTKLGLAEFSGNQWNEEWSWKRDVLMLMEESDLQSLYYDPENK